MKVSCHCRLAALVLALGTWLVASPAHAAGTCDYRMTNIPDAVIANNQAWSYYVPTYMAMNPPCDFDWQFSLTQAPAGMTINAGSGQIQWTPSINETQTFAVTVRLSVHYIEPTERDYVQSQAFEVTVCATADVEPILFVSEDYPGYDVMVKVKNNSPSCSQTTSGSVVINGYEYSWNNATVGPGATATAWSVDKWNPPSGDCYPIAVCCGVTVNADILSTLIPQPYVGNDQDWVQVGPSTDPRCL